MCYDFFFRMKKNKRVVIEQYKKFFLPNLAKRKNKKTVFQTGKRGMDSVKQRVSLVKKLIDTV